MTNLPTKLSERLAAGIHKYQPIIAEKLAGDKVNEADTSVLVTHMLEHIFGYDPLSEITGEFPVKTTKCDKAIKLDGEVKLLIEIKALHKQLDPHAFQAAEYAAFAKQGIDWVVLTNASLWRVYKMLFEKPVDYELVFEFNFCDLKAKRADHIELLSLLTKESWHRDMLSEFDTKRQALGKLAIAAVVLSEPVLNLIRHELKKLSSKTSPGIKIENAQIADVLESQIMKRELLDDKKFPAMRAKVKHLQLNKHEHKTDGAPASPDSNTTAGDRGQT
jgi:hypothetical protein